jgi:hypothetical protein
MKALLLSICLPSIMVITTYAAEQELGPERLRLVCENPVGYEGRLALVLEQEDVSEYTPRELTARHVFDHEPLYNGNVLFSLRMYNLDRDQRVNAEFVDKLNPDDAVETHDVYMRNILGVLGWSRQLDESHTMTVRLDTRNLNSMMILGTPAPGYFSFECSTMGFHTIRRPLAVSYGDELMENDGGNSPSVD